DHAALRGDEGLEGRVLVGRDVEVIGHLGGEAEVLREREGGRQETGLALDRRVGHGKIRRIEHGYAVELEPCVLVVDLVGGGVVYYADRLDLRERCAGRILLAQFAGRIGRVVERGDRAVGALAAG